MVKFSKQFELQLVPEWRQAFCDYRKLKKELKVIKIMRHKNGRNGSGDHDNQCQHSTYDGGNDEHHPWPYIASMVKWMPRHVQDVIKVHSKKCPSRVQCEIYETEVLEPCCRDLKEVSFFKSMDEELNKVNAFYASKEDEYSHTLDILKRQLAYLVEMRKKLEKQASSSSISPTPSMCFIPYNPSNITPTKCSSETNNEMAGCHIINHIESYDEEKEVGFDMYSYDPNQANMISTNGVVSCTGKHVQSKVNMFMVPKLRPSLTMAHLLWDNLLPKDLQQGKRGLDDIVTENKFKYARKKLRVAFVEFYRALSLLERFRSLNMSAFRNILKKYDKVTGRNASTPYLKALERSRLNNSNKVDFMTEEVEKLCVHYFANDDQRKAMMFLSPVQKKACHTTTYLVGLFSGWSLAFLASFAILLHFNNVNSSGEEMQAYARVAYPLYSTLLLVLLHMFMYGGNVYLWCRYRINYSFIFEFSPTTELRSREILLVCTCLTTIVVASMVSHLIFYFHGLNFVNPNSIPFATLLVFLLLLFCPFNTFHRSSRFFFLSSLKRVILAPFYKVTMADFFLADQLTCQVVVMRQVQHILCYYLGSQVLYDDALQTCGGTKSHQIYAYILSCLPYWWRLMQCLRRWYDEGDSAHLANGGKYMSAIIAVGCRLSFQFYPSKSWLLVFVITSSLTTIYQMYWDIVKDWGLLQYNSRNPWLRDELILKSKFVYFISMVVNCLLRLSWLQSLMNFQFKNSNNHYLIDFLFASLEVFRRGHWNFYRLENEHLNNVGKYRAVKTIPLPFRDELATRI